MEWIMAIMLTSGEPYPLQSGFATYKECITAVWDAQAQPFSALNEIYTQDDPDFDAYRNRTLTQFTQLLELRCLPYQQPRQVYHLEYWFD